MMKLSPKQVRVISYFLITVMALQSFMPYVPVEVKSDYTQEKNRILSKIENPDFYSKKIKPELVNKKSEEVKKEDKISKNTLQESGINKEKVQKILPSKREFKTEKTTTTLVTTIYSADMVEGEIGLAGDRSFDNPEDNMFTINLDQTPSGNQKVYLTYDLYGITDKTGVSRSINDRVSRGGYIVKTNAEWTKQKEEIKTDWVKKGENHIYFSTPQQAAYGYKIKNLKIEIENTNNQDKEIAVESYAFTQGDTYVKGYVNNSQITKVEVNGESVSLYQGEFETILKGVVKKVTVSIPGKKAEQKTIVVEGEKDYQNPLDLNITQQQQLFKKENTQNTINLLGAELQAEGSKLVSDKEIKVQNLRSVDIPALDMGLNNVTSQAEGYRFLPHGEHFTEGAVVKLGYDRTKIPNGYTEKDIKTYYFDLKSKHWVALERDSIDIANQQIISKTTHFTDMINGVIQAPESPETAGFTPTTMSDIKVADPLAKVNLVSPPQVNNRGSAALGYNFEMPPARNGMSPSVGIQYNSDGGSGWLGEGWDLNTSGISVDTRWGVPRYNNGLETETYLMGGSQLVTKDTAGNTSIAHRGDKIPREADRFFFSRNEGSFSKMQRKGNSPGTYTWEVTDRKGTKYFYGGNNGILKGSFTNAAGQTQEVISEWKLSRVEELHGDYIEYIYEQVEEPVRGGIISKALYVKEIHAGNSGKQPHTIVQFTRGKTKQKQTSNAKYGFLTSQNELLTNVSVNFEGSKLREYAVEYKTGEFYTDLLDRVVHKDNTGKEFSSNSFEYYNDVKKAGTHYKEGEEWNTHNDGISANFINPLSKVQTTGDFSDKATALGGSKSTNKSGSIYAGVGVDDNKYISKSLTGGASFGYSYSEGKGLSTLVDINGDGISDKVYVQLGSMYYRPGNKNGQYGNPIKVVGADQFSTTYTNAFSFGIKVYPYGATGGADVRISNTKVSRYFLDVNADGLVDLVVGSKVYFNHIENGVPTFTLSSGDTPSPINGGGDIDSGDTMVDPEEQKDLIKNSPLQDIVRVWLAPYDGMVNISGTAKLILPEGYTEEQYPQLDGVKLAVQQKVSNIDKEIKTALIKHSDTNLAKDMGVNGVIVKKGDKIYFRVQSGIEENSNGEYDQVDWSPVVTYTTVNTEDPNGYTQEFPASQGNVKTDSGILMLPVKDTYNVVLGKFIKPVTSDSITLKVVLGGNKVVYERTFADSETFNGQLPDTVVDNSSIKADQLQFIMHSSSNIAWDKISWTPKVLYSNEVEYDGKNYTVQSEVVTSAFIDGIYGQIFKTSGAQTIQNAGKAKIVTNITYKPNVTVPEINEINGNFTVTIKQADKIIYKGKLKIGAGVIKEGGIIETQLPKGKLWVELFSSDTSAEGLKHITAVTATVTDTLNSVTQASSGIYYKWNEDRFGPLHRNWGQFSYNAMDNRAKSPILENELKLPQFENDPMADPLKMIFIPTHLDVLHRNYWQGNDSEVYIKETVMSASRLGQKDVILDNPLLGLGNTDSDTGTCITGGEAIGIRQESRSVSTASLNGYFGATVSTASANDERRLSFSDFNGDGYPDIVSKGKVQFTNTRGGFDGEVIEHGGHHKSKAESYSIGIGGGVGHAYAVSSLKEKKEKAAENEKAAAESAFEKAKSLGIIPSGEVGKNYDEAKETFMDVNGDGLPDKILDNKRVRLNLGYAFSESIDWELDKIQKGENEDIGRSLGYDMDGSSISIGIGVNNTKTKTKFTMVDVNGDGLVDKVRISDGKVYASLNKGNSFANEIEWNGISVVNETSSVAESINTAYTAGIPIKILGIKISLNPAINAGQSMSRTLNDLQDIDGDGFIDVVASDRENILQVKKSTIQRTNKLEIVKNSIGGSFTLDYAQSEATYDHPSGKWVLSSVEVNDGVKDDGANTRVEYRYSQGKKDRHERDFLGFGKVETLSINTESGNVVYRKTIQEYDVNNYYTAGNLLKTTVEDAAGNKYAETINKYYQYEVKYQGVNKYTLTPAELCSDRQASYTPLKYTQSIVYEGGKQGLVANESFYVYDTSNNYGELSSYKYSDKSTLGENGTGAYNYETKIYYASNPAKNIFGLPSTVVVRGSDNTEYRLITALYDLNYADHLTNLEQELGQEGMTSDINFKYDSYGNIIQKRLSMNHKYQSIIYKYRYDLDYNMYLTRIDDSYGYTSELENYDYRYGIPLSTKDMNGYYMETTIDNLGRVQTITGPNELEQSLPYTIKYEYNPKVELDDAGQIKTPAYAVTKHYDPQHPGNDLETISFVDGAGRALQVKKDGVITTTDASGSNPLDKEVLIVSGRNKLDPFGRVAESYYPVAEDIANKLIFNKTFDAVTPSRSHYDVMDRAVETILPDNTTSKVQYTLDIPGRNMVTTTIDALGGKQATYTNGSGLTTKTEQLSGPNGIITTLFGYDVINQLTEVTDTEGQKTTSKYDLRGNRIEINHPSAGTTKLYYDPVGNLVRRQTSNLAGKNLNINYEYDYNRLVKINYPENPQNNITYHYGNKNAKENRVGRVVLMEDATGAQEFKYGTLGEVTEVRRTVVIPNQAIATYVTKTKYDSWNRVENIIYPDEEKVEYTYNTAGLLSSVKGSKAYTYNYVNKIGYDKFEQRNYLKYCNGAETAYTYDPQRRRLQNLQVWTTPSTNGIPNGAKKQIMNNQYTYDAVSNVLSVANMAPLPTAGQNNQGGQMTHNYTYDGLYRLKQASGTYTGADSKTAGYTLQMGYDNLHNITHKKQDLTQNNIMFNGGLKAGYDLAYTYNTTKKNQIAVIDDINYRTEAAKGAEQKEQKQQYQYDSNGNLIYVNTALKKADGTITDKTNERKLLWDEENRLKAIDDNGYINNYWYDASGERTIKTSGESQQVYVNALFAGGDTNTTQFTAYINPYLVVSPNGKYTKHYYIGSQRIVSKLGDIQSFGADPRRIEYAGDAVNGITIDWKGKYATSIQTIKDNYTHFEVPYNGKDNDDYVNGAGFCCSEKQKTITPFEAGIGNGNLDYEKLQYYYHPDHLGSSSYITNLDGSVVQHIEYVPFGEVFLEERNNNWNSPYLFNAKELDEETGLYYYGARYYNPRESLWLSVDPLSGYNPVFETEHYINGQHNGGVFNSMNHNTYGYCYQNPVLYIDPNGKQVITKLIRRVVPFAREVVPDIPLSLPEMLLYSVTLNNGEQIALDKIHAQSKTQLITKVEAKEGVATKSREKNDTKIKLYRGVSSGGNNETQKLMYQEAIFGVATPNGLRSFYKGKINNDMGEHAAGNNYSIWTSWTADKSVAEIFARGTSGKEGGIILEKDFDKKSVIINTSPEASLMQEAEWLVPGRVTGAKVNKLEAKK